MGGGGGGGGGGVKLKQRRKINEARPLDYAPVYKDAKTRNEIIIIKDMAEIS